VIYVMTRKHLLKARNIAENPNVSLVVPLTRRFLWFLPPPTIQLHGQAEIVDWTDEEGTDVFRRFWMGRRILKAYRESHCRGETSQEAHGIGGGQGRHPARVSVIRTAVLHLLVGVPRQGGQATACLSADHDGVW
jgi:hypothetical protein